MTNIVGSYQKLTKTELLDVISDLLNCSKRDKKKIETLTKKLNELKEKLKNMDIQKASIVKKRSSKRAALEAQNIYLLERAISVHEDFLDRPFEPNDYIKFERYLLKVYPKPAYVQAPRLTAEEKRLSPEMQEETREFKRRTGWSPARLRKFFYERTGVKPSTKKNYL